MEIPWAGTQGLSRSRSPPLVRPHDRRARGQAEKLEPQHTWLRLHPLLCHPQSDPHSCPGQVCSKVLGPWTLPSSCCLGRGRHQSQPGGRRGRSWLTRAPSPPPSVSPPGPPALPARGHAAPQDSPVGPGVSPGPRDLFQNSKVSYPKVPATFLCVLKDSGVPPGGLGLGKGRGRGAASRPCPRCAPPSRLRLPGSPYIRRPPVLLVIMRSAIRGTFQYF